MVFTVISKTSRSTCVFEDLSSTSCGGVYERTVVGVGTTVSETSVLDCAVCSHVHVCTSCQMVVTSRY